MMGRFLLPIHTQKRMNKHNSEIGRLIVTLIILLVVGASKRAESAEAVFLSANNEMHFAWFDNNTVVKDEIKGDLINKRAGGMLFDRHGGKEELHFGTARKLVGIHPALGRFCEE